MLFYIFLIVSAYLCFKEFRKPSQRKKLILVYTSVVFVGVMYQFGNIVGQLCYNIGLTF